MPTHELPKPHGFRLRAAASFYESFVPGSGMAAAAADRLSFAFRLDRSFEAVVAQLRETEDAVVVDYAGTHDGTAVAKQAARMLGLDASGEDWLAVRRRDPVVGKLQDEFPGFFTAAKASPYDAATWAVLAQGRSIRAASNLKTALSHERGDAVTLNGVTHHVFPSPATLVSCDVLPGVNKDKLARLHAVARAAREGRLDADRLRAKREDEALADLMTIHGVGPWAASHVYYRGAAPRDGLPTAEPRVLHGAASAYGMEVPSDEAFERMAEAWRPFRMWVCVLLSRHLASQGGWRSPRLAQARAVAGRRLERRLGASSR